MRLGEGDFSHFGVSLNEIIDNPNVAPDLASGVVDPNAWHEARRYVLPENAGRFERYCPAV